MLVNNNLSHLLILSSSGANHIPDIDQPVADRVQLRYIFHFEADGENTLAAGQIFAEQLFHSNPGGGHGGGYIQQQTVFPDLRIALLHGQMKGAEKEAAMASFARGEADVMVATTVIEVGVDVPNATLMVIEDADRFGLSQLHQLRGRVGRGKAKSYCILTSHNKNQETLLRLKALCKTTDGFKIAEEDLKMRGPGDFFGSRQSGLPTFRVANLSYDLQTLKDAQAASAQWIDTYGTSDEPEAVALRERIGDLFQRADGTMN